MPLCSVNKKWFTEATFLEGEGAVGYYKNYRYVLVVFNSVKFFSSLHQALQVLEQTLLNQV